LFFCVDELLLGVVDALHAGREALLGVVESWPNVTGV